MLARFPRSPQAADRRSHESRSFGTRLVAVIAILVWFSRFSQHGVARAAEAPAPANARPNVIVILADDLGYAELGCYGQKHIRTPHLDKMASEGVRFTQAYCGQAVCAPSRCALMTGKHMGHAAIRDNKEAPANPAFKSRFGNIPYTGQHPLPADEITLATLLKGQGYATFATGKWGLGHPGNSGDPHKHGFDRFFGYYCQRHAHNHYPAFLWRDEEKVPQPGNTGGPTGQTWSQDQFAAEALRFVRENKDRPFFLYFAAAVPHLSIQAPSEAIDPYAKTLPEADYEHKGYAKHPTPRAGYAAMVTRLDADVGRLLALIKELGLDDRTIVMFSSDNGPTYDRLGGSDSDFFQSAGPLRGFKGSLYEGGIRVPFIVRGPGRIPAGRTSEHPLAFWDVMPTVMDLVQAGREPSREGAAGSAPTQAPTPTPASAIDGLSFAPTLLGKGEQAKHKALYWEFPSYGIQQAVRFGAWKAIRPKMLANPDTLELYDLAKDPGEKTDLAAAHPEVVALAQALMSQERRPNPVFPLPTVDVKK